MRLALMHAGPARLLRFAAWSEAIAARHGHGGAHAPRVEQILAAPRTVCVTRLLPTVNVSVSVCAAIHHRHSRVTKRCAAPVYLSTVLHRSPLAVASARMAPGAANRARHEALRPAVQRNAVAPRFALPAAPLPSLQPVRIEDVARYRHVETQVRRERWTAETAAVAAADRAPDARRREASLAVAAHRTPPAVSADMLAPEVVHRITDAVVQDLDRRARSYRERMGVV